MSTKLRIISICLGASACFTLALLTGCATPESKSKVASTSALTSTNAWGGTGIMPPPAPGTAACGSYCGFIVFNNGGAGFSPDCSLANITVKINGNPVPVSQYQLFWRYSAFKKGCAQNISEFVKQYANVIGRFYNYTVYFKPGFCPPAGTVVEISVTCSASGASLLQAPSGSTSDSTRQLQTK